MTDTGTNQVRAHPASQDRATRPPAQARSGLGDTASVPCAAFTPGPWLRATNLVYALDDNERVNRFTASVSGGFTSYSNRTHTTLDEQEANARLIAAAPELLEALCDLMCYHDVPGPVDAPLKPLLDAGFAAIRKARGEQVSA